MTVLLRRHSAEEMLHLVSLNEELWVPRAEERQRNSTYRKVHNWLLKEKYFTRLLLRTGREDLLPGLKVRWAPLLWRRFLGTRVQGPCVADALRVKTNLRAFYPCLETPAVTKILLGQSLAGARKLQNEVEARSQVSRFGCVMVPQLLKHEFAEAYSWYTEQLIVGRTSVPSDSTLIAEKLVPGLMKMYERFGIVWRAPQSVLPAGWHEALQAAVDHIVWQSHWLPRSHFLDWVSRLTRDFGALPCSTGHGDLSPSNLVVTREGSVYVIDWEQAGFRPMIFDLAPLIAAFPGSEVAIRTQFPTVDEPPAALSFREQYVLGIAFHIVQWEQHAREHSNSVGRMTRLQNRLTHLLDAANSVWSDGGLAPTSRV